MTYIDYIRSHVPADELFCLLAEESSELTHAALKMARKINGMNPTPKTMEECYRAVIEEVADVMLVLDVLGTLSDESVMGDIMRIMLEKMNRWFERLKEAEGKDEA